MAIPFVFGVAGVLMKISPQQLKVRAQSELSRIPLNITLVLHVRNLGDFFGQYFSL
jgi:hypothetical protein